MGVTHIIRGEDHLNNAAKQKLLYEAMDWMVPHMAHIPLIHGVDGAKLSKRHGATNVEEYRDAGYLPQSIISYILRLGWSNDNDDIISMEEAVKIFDIAHIGKSCSRIDFDKLKNINFHYIKNSQDDDLSKLVLDYLSAQNEVISQESKEMIHKGMKGLKLRAHSINELADHAQIYIDNQRINYSSEAITVLANVDKNLIAQTILMIKEVNELSEEALQAEFKKLAEKLGIKLGALMQPIRCLLTGSTASPSVFEIISIIGQERTIKRLKMFEQI
jgi:glutamyl-tRNA synthetase